MKHNKIIPCAIGITNPSLAAWKNAPSRISSIQMPIQGEMLCKTADETKILKPGFIYFIANRSFLHFDLMPDSNYRHLFLNFRTLPLLLDNEMLEVKVESDPYLFYLMKAIEALIEEQIRVSGSNTFRGMSDPVWHQIRPILEQIVNHFQQKYHIATIDNPTLEKAIQYIEEHFNEPLQNKDIAAQLHIDVRYLIRLFSKHLDIPPHQYLTRCRIDHALTLLQDNVSITETAERCGYQSENSFRSAFKKETGVTPTQLLKQP